MSMANRLLPGVLVALSCVTIASGQTSVGPAMVTGDGQTELRGDEVPAWVKKLSIDPESEQAKKYAAQQKSRRAVEKELRKLRFEHFGQMRNQAIRQEGVVKLRTYTDPAIFPAMVEIFGREKPDVKIALMDQFEVAECPEGDGSIAWYAVHDKDVTVKEAALDRLSRRIPKDPQALQVTKLVIFEGLSSGNEDTIASAAKISELLKIADALPWLIATQVSGAGASTGGAVERDGALAYIVVGQQTAFVSDLTPVVSDNAVAFDPQLSVLTTGTILRVVDAAVYTYRVDVHNSLLGLSEGLWGQPTRQLGWNTPKWNEWYRTQFKPYWDQKQRELAAAKKAAERANKEATPEAKQPG